MNYKKHYDALVERARQRDLQSYTELHHIIPRCIGGDDDSFNLIRLSPEEHYVAHQLLVKMYPAEKKLVYAALMMTVGNKKRAVTRNNKRYGWLKRKHQLLAGQQVGDQNPSFGRYWYYCPETGSNGKFRPEDVPNKWLPGRKEKKKIVKCKACSKKFEVSTRSNKVYCKTSCYGQSSRHSERYNLRKEEFLGYIKDGLSFDAAIKKLGYKNWRAQAGVGKWAKEVLENTSGS